MLSSGVTGLSEVREFKIRHLLYRVNTKLQYLGFLQVTCLTPSDSTLSGTNVASSGRVSEDIKPSGRKHISVS